MPKLYVETYNEFEGFVCNRGVAKGVVAPLKKDSEVSLHFKSVTEDVKEIVVLQGKTRTCINLTEDIFPRIVAGASALWKDVPAAHLLLTCRGQPIQNPDALVKAPSAPRLTPKVRRQFPRKMRHIQLGAMMRLYSIQIVLFVLS